MDEAMELRRRSRQPPFDGDTVQSPEIRADEIRRLLPGVVQIALDRTVGDLVTFLDWHAHDGYVSRAEIVDRQTLIDALTSSDRFIAMSSDDTYVRRAWYPLDGAFLLRWCVSADPDDFGLSTGAPAGDFDLTGSAALVREIAALIPEASITPATTFFDTTWAG